MKSGERAGGKLKLLMHICCAPCATTPLERLRDRYELTAFFYNPNLYPREEYERRLAEARGFCEEIEVPLIEGPFDPEKWEGLAAGLEREPEGGRRCKNCIGLRLRVAADFAREHGFDALCTVLTVSPHKNALMINEIGEEQERRTGIAFLAENFKKRDGFRRSAELSRTHGLYRQDYCGCAPSLRDRETRLARKEQTGRDRQSMPTGSA